jgi:hypothetical protein
MWELPLLAPQWLQSDPQGRGSSSLLPNYNQGSTHSNTKGRLKSQNMRNEHVARLSMTEDATIRIDQKLCRVCTPGPNSKWHPADVRPTKPIRLDEHLVVTIPSCIRVSLWSPEVDCPGTVNMPPCGHTGSAAKGKESGPHQTPLSQIPLSCWQLLSRTCQAQPGSSPTLGEVVCMKIPMTSWSTHFQTRASSCPPWV